MQVTINVPDHIAADAAACGLALDTYIEEVLARQAQQTVKDTARISAVEDMREFGRKYGATLGDLKLKDLIHEGHKY